MRFLIHSNIFIALGALLFTFESQLLLGQDPAWHPYLFIIFFATFFEYNLHRLYTLVYYKKALEHPKHEWLSQNKGLFYLLLGLSALGLLVSVFLAKPKVLLALAPFAFLTIFYTVPLFKYKGAQFRLRDLPFLKLPLIALNWTFITILLPIIQHESVIVWNELIPIAFERFIFIFVLCLPFDIRDIETDRQSKLKTIPNTIGAKASWNLMLWLTISISMFSGIYHFINDGVLCSLAFILSGLYTIVVIQSNKFRQSKYFHYGFVDGAIHFQAILVYLSFILH